MLQALDFPPQMTQWIMECITTPWFSLSLNGSNFGYFQGKRGIRQGDPMSPLLLTLSMEYLSRILNSVTNTMEFIYHPLCRALRLTHMCFVDDLLMFCRGDKASISIILRAFPTFSIASGLVMNSEKSDIYFNGMSNEDVQYVLAVSGFREGQFPFRLVEKVVLRIRGWGARKLSYADRLVLVQASGSDDFHKNSPVAWDKVCLVKKFGGLGIFNCKLWNVAMQGKYVWWLAEKADHLWIRWVNHMYIKGQNWLDYVPSASSSWTWRKICQVQDQFKPAYCTGKWSTKTGRYNVYMGYSWLQGDQTKVSWYPVIWIMLNLPKHSFIGWLAIKCRLMTKDRLIRFGIINEGTCDICMAQPEDHTHLLYSCRFSASCWNMLAAWLGVVFPSTGILDWCCLWRCRSLMKKKFVITAVMAMVCQIWMARNICRLESKLLHPSYVVKDFKPW
ncbi:uncharacterized protein LOC141613997 [Silene latifolia]|uniref:uncharacterized protein LOC141613997 n=1 Tax=Silene latifolia TaxID=37657 RepID=UPI003D776F14